MSVAGGLANFVGDDTLVDASVGVEHAADDQAVDITNYRGEQRAQIGGALASCRLHATSLTAPMST